MMFRDVTSGSRSADPVPRFGLTRAAESEVAIVDERQAGGVF